MLILDEIKVTFLASYIHFSQLPMWINKVIYLIFNYNKDNTEEKKTIILGIKELILRIDIVEWYVSWKNT